MKEKSDNLPNLVIAGVNKAGTTSLFDYLASHPEICASAIKETGFFLPCRYSNEKLAPLNEYKSLFRCQGERIIMEATPGYFYGGTGLASKIYTTLPGVRIVIILREPLSRLISFFHFMKNMLLVDKDMSLNEYILRCTKLSEAELKERNKNKFFGVEGGCYSKYLPDWQKQFGANLKIFFLMILEMIQSLCFTSYVTGLK